MNYTKSNKCHNGPSLVVDMEGLQLFGASRNEAESNFYEFDLVISLDSCVPNAKPILSGDIRSVGLDRLVRKYSPSTEHLRIIWPDMGVPKLDKEFWVELISQLKKKGKDRKRFDNKYRVMVHCIGGHGRTGTMISILAYMGGLKEFNSVELIEIVREKYCSHVVESASQIEYVKKMTGLKLTTKGYKANYIISSSSSTKKGIEQCLKDDNHIRLHNKDIKESKNGKCLLCGEKLVIPINVKETVIVDDVNYGEVEDSIDNVKDFFNIDLEVCNYTKDSHNYNMTKRGSCSGCGEKIDGLEVGNVDEHYIPSNKAKGYRDIKPITQEELDRKKALKDKVCSASDDIHVENISFNGKCEFCDEKKEQSRLKQLEIEYKFKQFMKGSVEGETSE